MQRSKINLRNIFLNFSSELGDPKTLRKVTKKVTIFKHSLKAKSERLRRKWNLPCKLHTNFKKKASDLAKIRRNLAKNGHRIRRGLPMH